MALATLLVAMSVRIFADWLSQPSRAVIWMARLGEIPHEVVETRIAKLQHRSDSFAAVNPSKQVPAIQEEDGFCLSESAAILPYLAGKTEAGRAWYPADPRSRARVDEMLHWYHGHLRKGAATYIFGTAFGPLLGKEVPQQVIDDAKRTFHKSLRRMDGWLQSRAYLAGTEQPSVADILFVCELEQIAVVDFNISDYPAVGAWRQRMHEVPHFDDVHAPLFKLAPRFKSKL